MYEKNVLIVLGKFNKFSSFLNFPSHDFILNFSYNKTMLFGKRMKNFHLPTTNNTMKCSGVKHFHPQPENGYESIIIHYHRWKIKKICSANKSEENRQWLRRLL